MKKEMLNHKVLSLLKQRRGKCILSRRSCARHEAMEDLNMGSMQDIKEGCMIAVLATEDPRGYPFWIAKVMKVNT